MFDWESSSKRMNVCIVLRQSVRLGLYVANVLRALAALGHVPSAPWLLRVEQASELMSATHNLLDLAMLHAAPTLQTPTSMSTPAPCPPLSTGRCLCWTTAAR